ncbi:hypothetical protein AAHC03_022790 [Spirometra sp. Aus1]
MVTFNDATPLFLILLVAERSASITNGNIEFGFYPARIPTPQEPEQEKPVVAGWEKPEEPGTVRGRDDEKFTPGKLGKGATQRERLIEMLFMNYKTHERPTEQLDTVTIVKVNLQIQAIFSIEVQTMDYYMDTLLRQTWTDPRLRWNHLPDYKNFTQPLVSPMLKSQLWLPDLFFRNGKDGYLHKITLPNDLLRLYPNGDLLYSQKITMRFSCEMDLHTFPMDTQYCHMNIGSYGYTLDELKFVWRETLPVELPKKMEVPEFNTPTNFTLLDCSAGASTSTGNYSCLLARFMLKRQISSYLVNTYIPNILVIIVSWLSFYVSVDAAPARVPLGLMSLLGLLTQAASVTANLPRVSYIKAIDIWLIFAIAFVIGVLVEYAFAITLLRHKRRENWRRDVEKIVKEELALWCAALHRAELASLDMGTGTGLPNGFALNRRMTFFGDLDPVLQQTVADCTHRREITQKAKMIEVMDCKLDKYSRVLFPLCFIIYNTFYWVYYLVIVKQDEELMS